MFVQSEKFVEAHGGNTHDLAIYGQELNLPPILQERKNFEYSLSLGLTPGGFRRKIKEY